MANTLDRLEIAIAQNDKDWNSVKNAIVEKGIAIPQGTPTSEYGTKIKQIETGIDTSQDTVTAESMRLGITAHDAAGQPIVGVIPDYNGDISVELTSPNGITLRTAETYCETDIEIIPKLQNKTTTENGTIVPDDGHAGLKQVTVEVPQGPDLTSDTVTPAAMLKDYTAHDASGNQITGTIGTYTGSIQQGAVEDAQIRYDEGYEAGYTEGEVAGIEAGKKSEYDAFWDAYQQNGTRTSYSYSFSGLGWNTFSFRPKFDIRPLEASRIFDSTGVDDLAGILKSIDVRLDLSKCTSMTYFASYSSLSTLPEINLLSLDDVSYFLIYNYALRKIEKIILKEDGSQKLSTYTLGYNALLEEVIIEGVIGQSGLNVSWSPLSKASLISVVNALSSTTTGLAVTLRLSAVNAAFETSEGANDGSTSEEWLALVATKSNWTINLIDS